MLEIPKGDYGFYLNFTVYDNDDDVYDLTDYTLKLKVWTTTYPATLVVNGSVSAASATSGTCRYLVADGDFDTPGIYRGELELTKASVVESTKYIDIEVTESG